MDRRRKRNRIKQHLQLFVPETYPGEHSRYNLSRLDTAARASFTINLPGDTLRNPRAPC